MRERELDEHLVKSIIKSVNAAMINVRKLNDYSKKIMNIEIPKGAISRIFHDGILRELKNCENFGNAQDNISDFSYKGERWELRTGRTKEDIGINKVNILEKVKLLLINAIPEENKLFQIRVLDSRDRYFNQASEGTQIRSLNREGKEKAIRIYPYAQLTSLS